MNRHLDQAVASNASSERDHLRSRRYTQYGLFLATISCLLTGCPGSNSEGPDPGGDKPAVTVVAKRDEILISGGTFEMGSEYGEDDEKPCHKQEVAPFYIDRLEVTNAQYRKFVAACKGGEKILEHEDCPGDKDHTPTLPADNSPLGKHFPADYLTNPKYDDYPVVGVDYYDAWAYANWCGRRLPSEVEWEFVAKGGEDRRFPWGNDAPLKPTVRANFYTPKRGGDFFGKDRDRMEKFGTTELKPQYDGFPLIAPAGAFPDGASKAGVLNLAGNVWEWTDSSYIPYKTGDGTKTVRDLRVIRGGAWDSPSSFLFRCSNRVSCSPRTRRNNIGFRTAKTAK